VIPSPPFARELTPDRELARFAELKARLHDVWEGVMAEGDLASTSVVVPSFTLDQDELRKLDGVAFYEERLLFLLIRLRNPRAKVVYVTSQPVHPVVLDYYLHLLAGVPASHARARLTMLCAHDSSPRSLTEKVLERPRLIERIRHAIDDQSRAFLTVFNSTGFERKLAVLLGIPLNGLDPDLHYLGTKSGNRKIFKEAGASFPPGFEDLQSEDDVERALIELRAQNPRLKRAVIKLNESFSGEGNAIFRYPEQITRPLLRQPTPPIEFAVPTETPDRYFSKFAQMGGIVEEFVEGTIKLSPSAQFRTSPRGDVMVVSTHDQILGGPTGQVYLGCSFPAQDDYRMEIQRAGYKVGQTLARHGAVSRFGVDFLASRDHDREPWKIMALEINIRVLGTTHPFLALKFLTGGDVDNETGLFLSLSGRTKFYRATDNLRSERYRGLLPEDLIDIVTDHGLHYSHRTESGVLFHMIGALSQFGKLGVTVIASSREEVEELYARALEVLDAETVYGWVPAVHESLPHS
jgi:PGM1 C-terminal domain